MWQTLNLADSFPPDVTHEAPGKRRKIRNRIGEPTLVQNLQRVERSLRHLLPKSVQR
jgi:hypothetical protein